MALKDSVLNVIIRAKDLAAGTIEKFRQQLQQTEEQGERTENRMVTLAKRVAGLVAAYASWTAIKGAIGSIIQTGDEFERLGIQMEAVMGSIEAGERATAWIKEFTKNTPLQLEDTTQAFMRLKNFGLDPMDGTLQAVVDMNSKLGGSQESLIGISNALGQAWAKEKLQGEEILQLIERGVPVWELLQETTGKTVGELQELSSAGALGRDVMKGLIEAMGESATGAAARNMTTFTGIVSNLRDQFTGWLNEIAEAGVLNYFKQELSELGQTMTRLAQDGTLKEWAQNISDAIVTGAQAIKGLVTGLYEASGAIAALGKVWLALKMATWAGQIGTAATALRVGLAGGAAASTTAVRLLAGALRALPWLGLIEAAQRVATAYGELKKANGELAESVELMTQKQAEGQERLEKFREDTGLTVASLDELIQMQESGNAVLDEANNKWIAGREAVDEFNRSAKLVSDGLYDAAFGARDVAAATTEVIQQFWKLQQESGSTREALKETLGNYDLGVADDVEALVGALQHLSHTSQVTADDIRESVGDALSDLTSQELVQFQAAIQAAMEAGGEAARGLGTLLDAAVGESLKRLNVDVNLVKTGISTAGQEAIDTFKNVTAGIEQTGLTAEQSSQAIRDAFVGAMEEVTTTAGRAALAASLRDAFEAGKIAAVDYYAALQQVGAGTDADTEKVKQLREEIQRLREEMREGGQDGVELGDGVEQGANKGSIAMATLTAAVSAYRGQMEGLSQGAVQAWENIVAGTRPAEQATDAVTARIEELGKGISYLNREALKLTDATGLNRSLREMKIAANEVEIAFLEQTRAAQGLVQQYNAGAIGAQQYISQARSALQFSELLNEQDMGQLVAGIEAAERAMASLRDQTADTLGDLQDELDRLEGRTDKIREREYKERIAQLQGQLELAQYAGDRESIRNAEEALRLAERIYQVQNQRAKEAERERQAAAREAAQREADAIQRQSPTTRQPEKTQIVPRAPVAVNTPQGRTITLDLRINGATAGQLQVPDNSETNRVLAALERAGLSAAR